MTVNTKPNIVVVRSKEKGIWIGEFVSRDLDTVVLRNPKHIITYKLKQLPNKTCDLHVTSEHMNLIAQGHLDFDNPKTKIHTYRVDKTIPHIVFMANLSNTETKASV